MIKYLIVFLFFVSGFCYSQNPTLVYSTNGSTVVGGPLGNVFVNGDYTNSNIQIPNHNLLGNWNCTNGDFRVYGNARLDGTLTPGTNINFSAVSDMRVLPNQNGGAIQIYRYVDMASGGIALGNFETNAAGNGRIYYKTGSELEIRSADHLNNQTVKYRFTDSAFYATNAEIHGAYFFSDLYEAENASGSYMAFDGAGNIYFYSGVGVQFDTAYAYFFGTVQMGQAQNLAGEGLTLEQFYDGGITNYIQNTVKHWRGIGVVAGGAGITTVNPKLNGTNIFTTIVATPIATLSSSGTTLASMGFTKYIDGSMVNGTNFQFLSSVNGALAPNGTTNSIDILGY